MAKAKRKQLSRLRAREASDDTTLVRQLWACGKQTPLLRAFCGMLTEMGTPGNLSPLDVQAIAGIIAVEVEIIERISDFALFRCGNRLSHTISKKIETTGKQWQAQPEASLLILLRQASEAPAVKSDILLSRLLGVHEYTLKCGAGDCKTSSDIGVVIASFVRVLQDTKSSTTVPGSHDHVSEEQAEHVKTVNHLLGKTRKSGHIHQARKVKREERLASAGSHTTASSIGPRVGSTSTLRRPQPSRGHPHGGSAMLSASQKRLNNPNEAQDRRNACSKEKHGATVASIKPGIPVCKGDVPCTKEDTEDEGEVAGSLCPRMPLVGNSMSGTSGDTPILGEKMGVGAIQAVTGTREGVTECLSPISPRDGEGKDCRICAGGSTTLNLSSPSKDTLCVMGDGSLSTYTGDSSTRCGQEHGGDFVGNSGVDVEGSSRSTGYSGSGGSRHCTGATVERRNDTLGRVGAAVAVVEREGDVLELACDAAGGVVVARSGTFRSGGEERGPGQGGASAPRRQENGDIDPPSAPYCGKSGSVGAAANKEVARPADLDDARTFDEPSVGVVSKTPSPNIHAPLHPGVRILRTPPGFSPIPPAAYPPSAPLGPTPGLAPPRTQDVRLTPVPCAGPLGLAAQSGLGLTPRFVPPSSGQVLQPCVSPAQRCVLQPGLAPFLSPPGFTPLPGFWPLAARAPPSGFGPSPVARVPPGFSPTPSAVRPPPGFGPQQGITPLLILAPPPSFGPSPGPSVPPTATPLPNTIGNAAEGNDLMREGRFGFLVGLARMDPLVVRKGAVMGNGASAVVCALRMQDAGLQGEVDAYTGGCGLVVKAVPENGTESMQCMMQRELEVIRTIPSRCHANIMDFVSYNMATLSIVMPAAVGDLQSFLQSRSLLTSMSRGERMRMLAGAARGVHHLHSELGLTHCDLKPENMMVTSDNVLKIADFGLTTKSSRRPAPGLTKAYGAPEIVASFRRDEIKERTLAEPTLDIYPFGLMVIQMLFVQENPRLDREELLIHGLTPKNDGFEEACGNVNILRARYMATKTTEDRQYYELYREYVFGLLEDYAAQGARMADLRTTLLAADKWDEPGGLQFQEEVNFVLQSVLNKNPLRRLGLDRLAELLSSETLWATADATCLSLAGNIVPIFDEISELLTSAAHDTVRGKWWEQPCFNQPWWYRAPDVVPIV